MRAFGPDDQVGGFQVNVCPQFIFRSATHDPHSVPRSYRSGATKEQGSQQKPQSHLSRLCHAVLGADIGVIVCIIALLVWFGWLLVIEYDRPFAGAIVLALSILTFAVNKRDAERALCGPDVKHERQQNSRDYPSDNRKV